MHNLVCNHKTLPVAAPKAPIHVLLIATNADNRKSIMDSLMNEPAALHFIVTAAIDMASGLAALAVRSVDVILVDFCELGSHSGNPIGEIRAYHPQPLIALSGKISGYEKVNALNAGADDIMVVPYHADILRAKIDALVRGKNGAHLKKMCRLPSILFGTREEKGFHSTIGLCG